MNAPAPIPKKTLYTPSAWGRTFHSLTHDEALGAGSAGPGKSLVLLHDADTQIAIEHERAFNRQHPHHTGKGLSTGWALHLRRTNPMLELSIQRSHRVFPLMDPGAKWHEQKTTWVFSSGYRYQFGHCNDVNDWERYLTFEYTWIGFDELIQFTETQYDQIISRCRSGDPVLGKMLKIRAMSNPVMRREHHEAFTVHDPAWVRKRFVDPAPEGNVTLKRRLQMDDGTTEWHTWCYLPALLKDNPDPEFARSYEKRLQNSPAYMRQALLRGDWYVTEGSYYAELWNPQIHVCEPFKIPDDWPVFRSMDWGYNVPGCIHWWACDPEGTWYVFKELTFQGKTADVVAEMVRDVERDLGLWGVSRSKITGPADTQLWEARGEKGKSKAQEFTEKGVLWSKADKKSRASNAQRLAQLLSTDHGTRAPRIVFFRHCRNIIRTLPAIQIDVNEPDTPADGGEDHWFDSICYGAAHASRGRSYTGGRRDDDDEFEKEEKDRRDRGRYGYGSTVC